MRRRRYRVVAGALLALLGIPTRSLCPQSSDELSSGALFLLLPVGARAVGTGQAATADGGSSEAVFWNPAGLVELTDNAFAIHHYSVFAGTGDAFAGMFPSSRLGVFGIVLYQLDFGQIDVTGPGSPDPVGRISARNLAFIGTYATVLPAEFNLGLNFKMIQVRTDCSGQCTGIITTTGTTQAVDVGLQRSFGEEQRLRIGLVLQNLGFNLQVKNEAQSDPLPTRVKIGARYRLPLRTVADSTHPLELKVVADLDNEWGRYSDAEFRIGMDFGVRGIIHLRAGYAFNHATSRGASFGLGVTAGNFDVDVARTFYSENVLGASDPIQLSFQLRF